MNYYIELTLLDQPDLMCFELWSKVYLQLHIAFVEHKDEQQKVFFGVSFPQYQYNQQKNIGSLGTKIRVFAQTKDQLEQLNLTRWLEHLTDYVHLTSVREVPQNVKGYAFYKRKQLKTGAPRLARRRVKRGDITYEEALARYNQVVKTTNLPYVQLLSLSTSNEQEKKSFKLFIEKESIEAVTQSEVFSCYGLSSVSAVPEF
ncbi:hypothetical protein GCM10027155_15090 [Acinetobacter apis]|uniref:CRISPR-associated endonuclease Csy4 n=1 Tax=Acinetobacter apis TaxID=1229165 RepID=A0A217EGY8_9GAMM|nr:type I-F CRISPR-associated endoribonuclease Cas6/Csy4 [Acinetobacter apis]SNQ29748.1 CRISPR-associated endonuclease Csy4 [Acinetobacter apis]